MSPKKNCKCGKCKSCKNKGGSIYDRCRSNCDETQFEQGEHDELHSDTDDSDVEHKSKRCAERGSKCCSKCEKKPCRCEFIKNLRVCSLNCIRNPDLCSTNVRKLFRTNFSNFSIGTGPNQFSYVAFPTPSGLYVADDGIPIYDPNGPFLEIKSTPFTKVATPTVPDPLGALDRLKYFVDLNRTFDLPNDGTEVVFEINISSKATLGNIPPELLAGITNVSQDFRPAYGDFAIVDRSNSFMGFDIVLTNESIYAIYERFPLGRPEYGGDQDYLAFSEAIEIAKRENIDPINDFVRAAIAINRQKSTVRYFINGVEKLEISRIGFPTNRTFEYNRTGGQPQQVDIQSVGISIGNLTTLDATNPVYDSSLPMALATAGNINRILPLVQLSPSNFFVDPKRIKAEDGSDVQVGEVPYAGADPFVFLVPSDNTTRTRLFNNGNNIRVKLLEIYTIDKICNKQLPLDLCC